MKHFEGQEPLHSDDVAWAFMGSPAVEGDLFVRTQLQLWSRKLRLRHRAWRGEFGSNSRPSSGEQ